MAKKKAAKKSKVSSTTKKVIKVKEEKMKEEKIGDEVGKVTHYFSNIGVGVIKVSKKIKVGDSIRIKGATSDFTQTIDSMQIEHKNVEDAKKGQSIGLKVAEHAREHDVVYKV